MSIRVLICDDQEIVRKGLRIILTHADGIEVVGMATHGRDAIELVERTDPDVVLMDLKMPILNGVQATAQLVEMRPQLKVLVLTTYDDDQWVFDALRSGASGYLLKDSDSDILVQAIQDTAAGKTHLDVNIAGKVLTEFREQRPRPSVVMADIEPLSDREQSILEQMADGKSNTEIAEALHLAEGTVKNGVSQIIQKLNASSRTQAVLIALRNRLVDL